MSAQEPQPLGLSLKVCLLHLLSLRYITISAPVACNNPSVRSDKCSPPRCNVFIKSSIKSFPRRSLLTWPNSRIKRTDFTFPGDFGCQHRGNTWNLITFQLSQNTEALHWIRGSCRSAGAHCCGSLGHGGGFSPKQVTWDPLTDFYNMC